MIQIAELQIPETIDNKIPLIPDRNNTIEAIEKVKNIEMAKQLLCTSAYLISVSVRLWRGRIAVAPNDVNGVLSNKAIELYSDGKLVSPEWNFLPKKWRKRFTSLENKIRSIVNVYAINTPIRGVYVIDKDSCVKLIHELEEIEKNAFNPTVQSFFEDIDEIIESIEKELEKNKFDVEYININVEDVAKHFKLEKYIIPISTKTDIRFMTGQQASEMVEIIDKLSKGFIDETALYIYDTLLETLKYEYYKLTKKYQSDEEIKNSKLRSNSFNSLKQLMNKFNGFKFMYQHNNKNMNVINQLDKAVSLYEASTVKEQIKEGNLSFIKELMQIIKNCIDCLEKERKEFFE